MGSALKAPIAITKAFFASVASQRSRRSSRDLMVSGAMLEATAACNICMGDSDICGSSLTTASCLVVSVLTFGMFAPRVIVRFPALRLLFQRIRFPHDPGIDSPLGFDAPWGSAFLYRGRLSQVEPFAVSDVDEAGSVHGCPRLM